VGDSVRVYMGQAVDPQTKKLARLWKGPLTDLKRCGPIIDKEGFEQTNEDRR